MYLKPGRVIKCNASVILCTVMVSNYTAIFLNDKIHICFSIVKNVIQILINSKSKLKDTTQCLIVVGIKALS